MGSEVVRVAPSEWDQCPYKRDPSELPSPFRHMTHEEKSATWKAVLPLACWHPDARLPASRTVTKYCLLLISYQSAVFVISA